MAQCCGRSTGGTRQKSLADTIEIANSYAQADPTKPKSDSGQNQYSTGYDVAGGSRQPDRSDFRNKRKDGNRCNPTFIGAVDNTPTHDNKAFAKRMASKKKHTWDNALGQKEWGEPKGASGNSGWNYEAMLDQPCALHTRPGDRPSGHTTRQCSWIGRARKGDGFGPMQPVQQQKFRPPPRQLTGANTQMLPPQPRPVVQQQPRPQPPPQQ